MAWPVPNERRLIAYPILSPYPPPVAEATLLLYSGYLRKSVTSDGPCRSWEGSLTSGCLLMRVAAPTARVSFRDHSPLDLALRTGGVPAREQTEVIRTPSQLPAPASDHKS